MPLSSRTRIELSLWDRDLANDDPMGRIQLNDDHLMAALEARTIYHVRVDEQTNRQILLVAIAVD